MSDDTNDTADGTNCDDSETDRRWITLAGLHHVRLLRDSISKLAAAFFSLMPLRLGDLPEGHRDAIQAIAARLDPLTAYDIAGTVANVLRVRAFYDDLSDAVWARRETERRAAYAIGLKFCRPIKRASGTTTNIRLRSTRPEPTAGATAATESRRTAFRVFQRRRLISLPDHGECGDEAVPCQQRVVAGGVPRI